LKKDIWVEFSEKAIEDYTALQQAVLREKKASKENTFNMQLLKAIDREKANLKINPQHGTHIPGR
jgi:hypothetical protein